MKWAEGISDQLGKGEDGRWMMEIEARGQRSGDRRQKKTPNAERPTPNEEEGIGKAERTEIGKTLRNGMRSVGRAFKC